METCRAHSQCKGVQRHAGGAACSWHASNSMQVKSALWVAPDAECTQSSKEKVCLPLHVT